MKRRSFYLSALWLPLLWPFIFSIGELFLRNSLWHQMSKMSGLIILSGLFGGIQYLLFAVIVSYTFADKSIDYIERKVWILPLIFAPVCSVALWAFFQWMNMRSTHVAVNVVDDTTLKHLSICLGIGVFSFLFGYIYLFFMRLLVIFMEQREYFED